MFGTYFGLTMRYVSIFTYINYVYKFLWICTVAVRDRVVKVVILMVTAILGGDTSTSKIHRFETEFRLIFHDWPYLDLKTVIHPN